MHFSMRCENETIADKSPWGAYEMLQIICVLRLKLKKKHNDPFKNAFPSSFPPQLIVY